MKQNESAHRTPAEEQEANPEESCARSDPKQVSKRLARQNRGQNPKYDSVIPKDVEATGAGSSLPRLRKTTLEQSSPLAKVSLLKRRSSLKDLLTTLYDRNEEVQAEEIGIEA